MAHKQIQIDPEKFYSSKDAIKHVGTANSADTKRQMLLRHIRDGVLTAINLGGDKKPRYVIQGKHLIAYRNRQIKRGDYTTK